MYLQWKHIEPKKKEKGESRAAKVTVYAGDREQYYSFITPEVHNALKERIDYRKSKAENITGESQILINKKVGLASCPKRLSYDGITRLLLRTLKDQGLRKDLPEGQRRYEWKAARGYRKFYNTYAAQVMKPLDVKLLMGHSTGLEGSYYKPTQADVLEDYLKAVPPLAVNYVNDKKSILLQKQISELAEKNEEQNYVIKENQSRRKKKPKKIRRNLVN